MSVTIKLRRGTSLEWTNSNPNVVLSLGEPGFETDTHKLKIGDGTTAWNSLDYVSDGFSGVGGPLDYAYMVSYSTNTFFANYDANDVINNLHINPTSHDIDFSAYYDDLIDNSYAINITLTQVEDADKAILFSCNNIVDLTSTPPYPYYSFDVIELSRSASFTGFENTKKYYLNIDIKGQNFPELTEDRIDSLIVATSGISKNYDDSANPATLTLSIDPTFLNTSLVAGSGISLDYADDQLTVNISGLDASYISDFSSSVSGLLPVKNVVQGSGVSVTSSSGTFTVGVSGLNSSYIADFSSSVSGLLPVKNVVQGSGVSVTSSSGVFTVGVSGLDASYISDFSSSVSGLLPVQIASVDLHNGGVVTAQVLQFNDDSQQSVITGPTPPSGNSSQRIIIQGQRAQGGGEGGDVYIWSGDSDAYGGDIKIYAGDADNVAPDSGEGGYVRIDGGKGATTGGNVEITAGYSEGGQAGDVEIVGGSTSSGVAGNVNIKTNNDNGSFNTWTFSPDGSMTLPSGSILSETNNTISIMPPTAVSGQSLVIRPTQTWSLTSNHPSGFAPGDSITITFTPNTSSVGSFSAAYTFTGCTEEQLGRSLTGSLVYTEEETQSLTWTIPSISNITSFTFTIQNVVFPQSADPFITLSSTGSVSNEPSHLHLVAGDPTTVDLFLGDDDQYVKIGKNGGDVVIGTNSDTNHWTFGADGTLTLPQGGVIDETLNVDTLTLVNAGLVTVNQTYIKTSPILYTGSDGVTIEAIGDGVWFCIQGGDTKYSSTDNLTTWDNSTGGLPVPTSTVNPGVDTVNITVGNETWTFGQDGNLTFPDGSIQTTAYIENIENVNISTCLLHEYSDLSGVSTPTSVAIDGMSYGGGQVVVDSAFGLGSSRVTLYSDSMFAVVAVNADIETVYYNGESGADSNGDKSLSVGVSNYRGYYSYHNLISGDDPAIQQIVISKSSIMSGSNRSIDTNNDDFTVDGLSGSDVIIVLNLYWASTDGPDNSSSTTVAIQQFIDLVMFDEATPRTNINDIRTAFYDNSATIKTAIENENSDLLFDGFEFYRSFQNVTPSGGSGSGAVLEIEVFDNGDYDDDDVLVAGTGYQVEDTLTVTGDLLGGTTPTNDVTITVDDINEAGGIIGYSVVGTSVNNLWPDSYIIDGDDDQYDIGNFIGTNRTRSTAMVTLAYDPIEEDGNGGGDEVFQILTILSADKMISEGQWVWFEEQNAGAFINHTLSTGGLNSSDISDFSSAVSELIPVKNVVQGSGVSVTSSSGTFTVGVSGLNASYISDFSSSVSGLLPVKNVVQGSGVSVTSSSGTFTVGVSGLNASYISDFSSSVSGLLPTLSAGSGINLSAGSGNSIIISSSGTVSSYPTPTVVNLSVVSSTISTDASAGQIFNVALTSSATLSNPTNPIDGVTLRWRIQQDAYGSRTVTLGDKFQIPTSATSPLPFSTAPYTIDLLAATYNSATDKWDIIAFVMGY